MTLLFRITCTAWSLLVQGDPAKSVAFPLALSGTLCCQVASPNVSEADALVPDATAPASNAVTRVQVASSDGARAERVSDESKTEQQDASQDDYADFAVSLLDERPAPVRATAVSPAKVTQDAPPAEVPIQEAVRPAMPSGVTLVTSAQSELISLPVKTTREIAFDEPLDGVAVEDPEPVGVRVLTPRRLAITGKEIGTTTLTVEMSGTTRSFFVRVEPNLELVRSLVASVAPTAEIELRSLNGAVFLTGRVPDAETAELIKTIAAASVGEKVVSSLRVAGLQQTLLRVVVAEVNKNATRQLGINWAIGASGWSQDFFLANNLNQLNPTRFGSSGVADVTLGQNLYSVAPVSNGATTNVTFGFPRAEFQVFLHALRENGLARTLAEPNLVAISGQTATFLVGGEVPLSVVSSTGGTSTVSIIYKEFGIRLAFTPTVLGGQLVRLHVMSEVSQPTPSSVTSGGLPVFSFETRRVETTIECGNGQTFAIAGLLSEDVRSIASKIPGLGDIPVLGTLFSSTSYQKEETELVVLVTPQLVEPLDPDQVPDAPGAQMTEPTDFELFALQKLEGTPREPASNEPAMEEEAESPDDAGTTADGGDKATSARGDSVEYDLRGPWGFEDAD